jgi:hypothetical protein
MLASARAECSEQGLMVESMRQQLERQADAAAAAAATAEGAEQRVMADAVDFRAHESALMVTEVLRPES